MFKLYTENIYSLFGDGAYVGNPVPPPPSTWTDPDGNVWTDPSGNPATDA